MKIEFNPEEYTLQELIPIRTALGQLYKGYAMLNIILMDDEVYEETLHMKKLIESTDIVLRKKVKEFQSKQS